MSDLIIMIELIDIFGFTFGNKKVCQMFIINRQVLLAFVFRLIVSIFINNYWHDKLPLFLMILMYNTVLAMPIIDSAFQEYR